MTNQDCRAECDTMRILSMQLLPLQPASYLGQHVNSMNGAAHGVTSTQLGVLYNKASIFGLIDSWTFSRPNWLAPIVALHLRLRSPSLVFLLSRQCHYSQSCNQNNVRMPSPKVRFLVQVAPNCHPETREVSTSKSWHRFRANINTFSQTSQNFIFDEQFVTIKNFKPKTSQ